MSTLASAEISRNAVVRLYEVLGAFSSKTGLDPIVDLSLAPLGINARFSFHLLNRDLNFLLQVFVLRVYEKYCPLEPGDVVVDCGAYIGEFTTRASKIVGPKGLVLSFEANPQSYSLCVKNIRANNLTNVKLYNVALGEYAQTGYLKVDKVNLGATRVLDRSTEGTAQTVQVRPLSEFLSPLEDRPIKLLKMNVEGSATKIMTGAPEILERRLFQNLSAELHPGEEGLQALLDKYGYRCTVEGAYLYACLQKGGG